MNFDDPFGLAPCTTDQLSHGWKDVTTADGAKECQSNESMKPVESTAPRSSFVDATIYNWGHASDVSQGMRWKDVQPLEGIVPAWMGGPGAAS